MFDQLHSRKKLQLVIGLLIGFGFGFLLQKGAVTKYNVIIGQLLLTDFTVLKVMLTAVLTGMVGIYTLKTYNKVRLHPKTGSIGSTVIGGLIFGVGFAVLGYCPGTVAGAAAQGSLDALVGGILGMFAGVWIYTLIYPVLDKTILNKGDFGKKTLYEVFKITEWMAVAFMSIAILVFLLILETQGM
jgi:hypothetical protein